MIEYSKKMAITNVKMRHTIFDYLPVNKINNNVKIKQTNETSCVTDYILQVFQGKKVFTKMTFRTI